MWRTIATGNIWRGEVKNCSKSGQSYWVDTTIGPILNEQGKPKGYLAIRTDITESKQAEEEIQRSKATGIEHMKTPHFTIGRSPSVERREAPRWTSDAENTMSRISSGVLFAIGE